METKKFDLLQKKTLPVKGSYLNEIKISHNGQMAFVNYAGNVLMPIDINAGAYGKYWDFRHLDEKNETGLGDIFPSPKRNLVAYTVHVHDPSRPTRYMVGAIDIDDEDRSWVEDVWGKTLRFSEDGEKIAMVYSGGVLIRSVKDGSQICSIKVEASEDGKVLFHPSGDTIACMGRNKLSAFELPSGRLLWEREVSGGCGYDIWEFSHGGELFAMCNLDQASKICDSKTGKTTGLLKKGNDERTNEIHFSKDDKKIITCSVDQAIRVWDVKSAGMLQLLNGHDDNSLWSVRATDDFQHAVSFTSYDNKFYLWDLAEGKILDKITTDFQVDDFKLIPSKDGSYTFITLGSNYFSHSKNMNKPGDAPLIHIWTLTF